MEKEVFYCVRREQRRRNYGHQTKSFTLSFLTLPLRVPLSRARKCTYVCSHGERVGIFQHNRRKSILAQMRGHIIEHLVQRFPNLNVPPQVTVVQTPLCGGASICAAAGVALQVGVSRSASLLVGPVGGCGQEPQSSLACRQPHAVLYIIFTIGFVLNALHSWPLSQPQSVGPAYKQLDQ